MDVVVLGCVWVGLIVCYEVFCLVVVLFFVVLGYGVICGFVVLGFLVKLLVDIVDIDDVVELL